MTVIFAIRLNSEDPRVLLELSLLILQPFLNWIFSNQLYFIWLWLLCISWHGCFPVKSPNYFMAEAPSNPLLILPFKSVNYVNVNLVVLLLKITIKAVVFYKFYTNCASWHGRLCQYLKIWRSLRHDCLSLKLQRVRVQSSLVLNASHPTPPHSQPLPLQN